MLAVPSRCLGRVLAASDFRYSSMYLLGCKALFLGSCFYQSPTRAALQGKTIYSVTRMGLSLGQRKAQAESSQYCNSMRTSCLSGAPVRRSRCRVAESLLWSSPILKGGLTAITSHSTLTIQFLALLTPSGNPKSDELIACAHFPLRECFQRPPLTACPSAAPSILGHQMPSFRQDRRAELMPEAGSSSRVLGGGES